MTRRIITAFFRFCLRIFYRRVESVGLERVPGGPVIFAINHPNGLVDPLFVLCFTPRRVSFLAKAPLFRYPVIGWFARAFDGIPVYRKQDQTRGSNREMFERARAVLQGGGSIAIFPEGTTHSDPRLRELKTGVARIALGAKLDELFVVPTGIYYTAKQVFRSQAMVVFGEPLRVSPSAEQDDDEPHAKDVADLTAAIDASLGAVTLQADSQAALELIARAERIFTADDKHPLAEELEVRRRFVAGYHYLRAHDPERLERLASSIAQLSAELRRAKLAPHALSPRLELARVIRLVVLLPLGIVGAIVSYLPYKLIGVLAKRFSKGENEMVATIKILASFALYPIFWIGLAAAIESRFGLAKGIVTLIALPFLAYLALRVSEDLDDVIGDLRGMLRGPRFVARREAMREEMFAIARALEEGGEEGGVARLHESR